MFCVNIKSKEFKDACSRLDIHPSSLEPIVFHYLNNIDSEGFPSDAYIMERLKGKVMTHASKSQILLWEKAYSTPKVFSDRVDAGNFIKEATKYFSPESISTHRNNNGQYVVSIEEPTNIEEHEKLLKTILDKAPRNKDGKLLAPNGEPTKLSDRQYAQVRTPKFKKWFGDWTKITKNEDGTWNIPADVSKVIDEETGEPKVAYHGSPNNTFTVFDKEKIGSNTDGGFYGRGFYFSEDKGISNKYGKEREFFLNIKNPYEINPDKIGWKESTRRAYIVPNFNAKEATPYDSELSKYDGVLQTLMENGEVLYMAEIVIPNANQIKSATDNIGTFSENTDDIMYSYNPSSRGMVSFSTRERVKNHYLRTVPTSVERSIQTIEALQKVFSNIRISTADSNMSDANGFAAMEDAQKLAAQARLKYGNLAEVRVVEGKDYIELQIKPKSKEELQNFYTNRVYEYIRNLSNEDILNELLTIESDYYEDLAYHIKAKDIPIVKEQIAKKNANITAQEIEEDVDFLVSLENNPETNLYVNTCIKWLKNGVIRLPQDNDAILAIFKMAREEGFDVQKLKHPFDVIRLKLEKSKKEVVPGKAINPREIPQFHYSHSIETEEGTIEVYDVENSYEGQSAVSQVLADTAPKLPDGSWVLGDFTSPWCLATFNYNKETGKATPSTSAKNTYWNRYNAGKRQIAFYNGIPIGFNSSSLRKDEWWDFYDRPHDNVDASFINAREKELKLNTKTLSESIRSTNLGFAEIEINNEGELGAIRYPVLQYTHFFGSNRIFYPKFPDRYSVTSYLAPLGISIRLDDGNILIKDGHNVINPSINESKKQQIQELITELKKIKNIIDNGMSSLIEECEPFAKKLAPIPKELESDILRYQKFMYEESESIYKQIQEIASNILSDIEGQRALEEIKSEIPKEPKIITPNIAGAIFESLEDLEEEYIELREPVYVEPENIDTRVTPEEEYATHTEEMDPIEENILNSTTEKINKKSKYRRFTPKILQRILQSIKDIDYKSSYNRHYQEAVNQDLEVKLKDILEHYHFEVLETSMKEVFGDNILGATDFLNKVIYLAERGDRNAITGVEEFAHAFVKMMGSIYHKPENRERFPETKIYSEIRDEIENTSLYQQVLERYSSDPQYQYDDGSPNIPKIKEEAIGQSLAAVLLDRYEIKNRKDKSFFDKIKQWFRTILTKFKAIFVHSAYLDEQLMSIADSILDGTYHKKFLQKVNDRNYKLQNYIETIENSVAEDGGLSLSIMQDAVACGGIITGSLSYRMQTPVYRDNADALHDIDIAFPLSNHLWHARHPFFRNPRTVRNDRMMSMDRILQEIETFDPIARFKERQPNTTLMYAYWGDKDILVVNAIVSENEELKERFKNLTGNFNSRLEHFTEEERKQIRLIDFFFNPDNKVEEDVINDERFNLKLANYKHSFRAKLKYGRAKDIYDYQTLNPVNRQYLIDRPDVAERQLMWQKKPTEITSTEESITTESSSELKTRTQNEEFMENNKALIAELENLYDLGLTDTDIHTIGTQLMQWISEHLTVLHNTPGELKRVYNIDKDASTMSRKYIAELVTPKRLMEQCIREFRRPKAGMSWEDVEQLNDIADNARLLLFLSSNTFTALEGFSIIMPGADFGVMANIDVTTNEFNTSNEDVEIQEEEGSSIEHWIRANTTITLDERISLDVKTAIYKCYRIGKDGKPVVSKWGIKERIPYEEARNIIVNICSGCLTLNMMVDALDKAKEDYPWLEQLIVQIRPSNNAAENGARTQLQSAFFRDMYMARNAYSVVKKNDGKFESVIVNENTALKEITSSIITEFTIGSHPLFGDKLGTDSYKELVSLYEEIKDISDITTENRDKVINALLGIYNNLGFYNITQDLVESILTKDNVNNIASSLNDLLVKLDKGYRIQEETGNKYYPFEYSIGKSAPNSILGNLRAILRIPASKIDNTTAFSVYDNGKMHQSFCTPSYLFKLMTKLGLKDDAKFREFMSKEFDQYQWFAIEQDGKIVYRLSWLQEMQNQETREILKHKIQLNFNKHNYMRNMNSSEYALSVLAEFFCEKSKLKGRDVAWYRVPMLSNKPSSEFIRFVRYTGPTYKDVITHALYEVYSQEMSRIQTVRLRNQHPESVEYISNFDKRGLEFCFLTFLNEHLGTSSELGLLMEQRLNGNTDVINLEEEKIKEAIKEWMNQRSTEIINNWEDSGILEKAEEIANIGDNKIEVKRNIENFIWNDVLASINIQELTITDPALYKDVEDIQKRIAQMHSPGIRPNVDAVDFEGNNVSDGYHRALTFADFEDVISNVIDNITVICDRRIENAKAKLKKGEETSVEVEEAKAFKELLVGKDGLYRQINATDAQAYSCATSYRKKAFMFGKWSRSAEAIYHKLKKGEYVSMSDIQTAFQPLKPFVYSQISKSSGVKDAPMPKLRVGIQNKNSEYLLIMAEALIQNENTGKPNLLRAINEFMEETADRFPTRGIDTIEYGSAVKVGKQTRLIDISKATSVEDAKEIMRAHVFKGYKKGTWDTYQVEDPNNPYTEKVDTIPAEDYSIQQEVPAHFRDHQQAEGSQSRAITPSDLPSVDANGNPVTFATGYNIDGTPTGHMSSKEFVKEWEETHAANIDESIDLLVQELKLDSLSKKDRNITIARLLQKEILANPNRYGTDLLIACSLDANYEFRIPLGDPIQSKRVEQLLNSIVKNRINKQTIAGGPIVQVSNFGTSKQLSIKFNGKDGKILDSYEEWSSKEENKGKSFEDYKKYIKENQAGIAYMECLAPAYTKELFTNFMDENGNVDIEAVEATSPELLKMIGYRIPTEDKYSISPLKIVGFLPRVAGDGIMLPYDITLINGSDFDIDKMYVMFKEYTIKKKKFESKDEASSLFKGIQSSIYHSILNNRGNNGYNQKEVEEDAKRLAAIFLNKKVKVDVKKRVAEELKSKYEKKWETTIPDLYQAASKGYRANRYECVEPTSPRAKRNNKIVDMTYAVMTHETTVDKALNPGGFEAQKYAGYLVEAFRKAVINEKITDREALIKKFKELSQLSADELKTLAKTKGNLIFIDTQVQFYEQNNAAGALIGIFAVDKVAHAFLGNDNLTYHGIKRGKDFSIDGIQIINGVEIDPVLNRKGQYIGKILGSLVASAADAVKDPVLNLMNINGTTAATLCTMIRLGIPFETAALFLSSKAIKDCLSIQAKENLNKFTTLNDVIKKEIDSLGINSANTKLNEEDLSEEEMIIGLVNPTDEIKYKTLRVLSSILSINSDVKSLSFPTRMNSMAGAVGPLAIDNLILMHKINNFPADTFKDEEGNSVNVYSILENHPMLKSFFKANGIAEMLLKDIPANSNAFRGIVNSGGKEFAKTLYGDRKLLSKLSDFYLSYILVSSGVINPKHTVYYVEKFPKFYMDTLRENPELKDNPLIEAIKLDVDRKTKKPVLKVETTGASITYKESLMGGWTELVRNPKTKDLAIHLFMYNFFRGGVVFNPKTFMGLTPYQVKEAIPGYREAYTKVSVSPSEYEHIIDLFIRNNWNETKLVPKIEEKQIVETISKAISENKEGGEISIPNSYKELEGVKYFKVSVGKEVSMYKVLYADENSKITTVQKVDPLGNNSEYLELSKAPITDAITKTTESTEVDDSESAIGDTHLQNSESPSDSYSDEAYSTTTEEIWSEYEKIEHSLSGGKVSLSETKQIDHLIEVGAKHGVTLNSESIKEESEKYC